MAYTLTLTADERKAIDWIGNRYSNGSDLYTLLWCQSKPSTRYQGEDTGWDIPADITFNVPEHVAWQIKDNADSEDGRWPCFAPDLASKMQRFVDSIV